MRRFPANPPAFAPAARLFPALRPRLARDPARFVPEGAPRVAAARLGVRRYPELGSRWGFRPALLRRFAVVKRVPPRGASIPGSDFQETAAHSRVNFREIRDPG